MSMAEKIRILLIKRGNLSEAELARRLQKTPQSFNIKKLTALYQSLTAEEKAILTDAAKIFVVKGEPVRLVKGEVFNMKITTQYDLKIANSFVKGEKNDK